jgi:hypothetical protein
MDYLKETYKLISNYLPLTNIELGSVLPAVSVEIEDGKIILELSDDDYDFIRNQITENDNYCYTASNFKIKNSILDFQLYPEFANSHFGFLVKFSRLFQYDAGSDIELLGFEDGNYNTTYRVVRKIDDINVILAPLNDLEIIAPVGDLGFYSTLYSSGLNGTKIITDEDDNKVSFLIEENSISSPTTVDNLDLTTMPNLWFYQNNILTCNLETFTRNLTDESNQDYLIIDTTSLAGSPIRSRFNNSDAAYFSFSTNAYFYRNYSFNIYYRMERSVDDSNNMTETGADISAKQVSMFDALTSILRRPIPANDRKIISSMTITDDSVDASTIEGSVIVAFQISFVVNYLPNSLLDLSDNECYKINQVNYNKDEIIV